MSQQQIPVCVPLLPTADRILPYLQQIDAKRWYSNFGPLHELFIARLAELFRVQTSHVLCAATGTQLLELCLKAFVAEPGSLCVMPAWTFVATPLAAVAAKLEPFFVDVDLATQMIDPVWLLEELPRLSQQGKIGAVVVTAPFGCPINRLAWDDFTAKTGIPVLIDAAAAFDTILQEPQMQVGRTPMMVSLHATKVFGIGEGAVLLSTDEALMSQVVSMTQFGFPPGVRSAYCAGTNAKISEYTAAVGLAALDAWPVARSHWEKVSKQYQRRLGEAEVTHMFSFDWVTSVCNIIVPYQADGIAAKLDDVGVMTRKWWGDGCHHQPIFQQSLRSSSLKNTEYLQKSVLGLPFYVDMANTDIELVIERALSAIDVAPQLNAIG